MNLSSSTEIEFRSSGTYTYDLQYLARIETDSYKSTIPQIRREKLVRSRTYFLPYFNESARNIEVHTKRKTKFSNDKIK